MTLPSAGVPLSLNDIHVEVQGTSGTQVSLNDTDVRALINSTPSTQVAVSDFYGASYNQFAALIGPSDTGDSFLYGYQTLNAGAGTVLGSEGLHTWTNMRTSGKSDVQPLTNNGLTYYAVPGWKRHNGWAVNNNDYNMSQTNGWTQTISGFTTSNDQITVIEYRIITSNWTSFSGVEFDTNFAGQGVSWGDVNFNDARRWRFYGQNYGSTEGSKGMMGGTVTTGATTSGTNFENMQRIGGGKSIVNMWTYDRTAGTAQYFYVNNGGSVTTVINSTNRGGTTASGWWLHMINNSEWRNGNYPNTLDDTGFQQALMQGCLYVDRIVTTTELSNVANWLYNSSGVPNHTDQVAYTDGTFP